MALLTDDEQKVLDRLGDASKAFSALSVQHPSEPLEWAASVHRLLDLVAARPTYRAQALGRGTKNGERP